METKALDRNPTVPLERLLNLLASHSPDPDLVSTAASRLVRLEGRLTGADQQQIQDAAGGVPLRTIVHVLLDALDPDLQYEAAQRAVGRNDPNDAEIDEAAKALMEAAVLPLASNPALRDLLVNLRRSYEQIVDETNIDVLIEAGISTERARKTIEDFRAFIEDNKDEITALQIMYNRPYQQRLTFKDIRDLATAIGRPPHQWTPEGLWAAYEALDRSKVHGSGQRTLTDIVSLVRFTLGEDEELVPFTEKVRERFSGWLLQQDQAGRMFTPEQRRWLEDIRDHVEASMGMTTEDFDFLPFIERGGIGKAYEVFGDALGPLLEELNEVLAA